MYQTPFRIKSETIQLISDIAEFQAVHRTGACEDKTLSSVLKENFVGLEYRRGYGTGRIPFLVQDLIQWVDKSKDHILIKGCVVLYELENLSPFDGDCHPIAVKCLKDMLCTWNAVFSSIQIEDIISDEIERYRRILADANEMGDSGIFITYMLGLVLSSLKVVRIERTKAGNFDPLNDLINLIENDPKSTYVELAAKLSVSPATIKRRIAELKKTGVIKRVGSKKTGNWQIIRSNQ